MAVDLSENLISIDVCIDKFRVTFKTSGASFKTKFLQQLNACDICCENEAKNRTFVCPISGRSEGSRQGGTGSTPRVASGTKNHPLLGSNGETIPRLTDMRTATHIVGLIFD